MNKICFIYLILIFSISAFSQPWTENLPKNKSTAEYSLQDYQKAFNLYWAPFNVVKGKYIDRNGKKVKAPGWKQFMRWEWYMEKQTNNRTGAFPKTSARAEFEKVQGKLKTLKSSYEWQSIGPISSTGGYAGIGRINCVAFHPWDNNTYWVGTPSGGLWMTTNNGQTWDCLTDKMDVIGVSSIIIPPDYEFTKTIYIGTGDRDAFDNFSIGILKSTNGGLTWMRTGLSKELHEQMMVTKMLLDPNDYKHIIVTTNKGVFETKNGAGTFTKICDNPYVDIENKPGDFTKFYCSWRSLGMIDTLVYQNGVWEFGNVYSNPDTRRIELAVSPDQPSWVYAVAASADYGLYAVYKSEDSGENFYEVFSGSTMNLLGYKSDGSSAGGQGFYDLAIDVDPTNANFILIGGINTWFSPDGGANWSLSNHWIGDLAQEVHADKHNICFRPLDNSIFELNDGGIYISQSMGMFNSWLDLTNGIIISQMYKLGVSKTNSDEIITGLQDNGTKLYSDGQWADVYGGDGMECLIDNDNTNIQYATYVNGEIAITTDHWQNYSIITPTDINGNYIEGAWVTPFIIHPNQSSVLYAGFEDVYKTTDRGNSWTMVSSFNSAEKIRSLAICENYPVTLYAADLSQLWKSEDDGNTWVSKSDNLPADGDILSIAVEQNNPNTIWITLSGYQHPGVYQSKDGGDTWTNISGSLPQIPIYTIVQDKSELSKIDLYVGTELGVYYKSGNEDWLFHSSGLPNVIVSELEIYYNKTNPSLNRLRAATYGRGLWETPLVSQTAIGPKDFEMLGISLYPNPSNGEIYVKFKKVEPYTSISVKDISGKTILTQKVLEKSNKINLEKQAKGIYIIEINWPGERAVAKMIVQ